MLTRSRASSSPALGVRPAVEDRPGRGRGSPGGRWLAAGVALLLVLGSPICAAAEVDHQIYGALSGGVWPSPNPGGHGVAIVEWRAQRAPGAGSFTLGLNTDTLRVRYDDVCFGRVCVGGQLAGEAFFAGLLSDYYQRGERDPRFEMRASYIAASGHVELRLPDNWFARYTATGRKWFFSGFDAPVGGAPIMAGGPGVGQGRPPPDLWVAEQALAVTYWQLEPDAAQWQPHRLFPRVRGFALGLRGEVHVRSEARPWGESDISVPDRDDRGVGLIDPPLPLQTNRNDSSQVILLVRQWARYGAQVHPRLRLQLEERFGWGRGEDDLTRDRIGGLNPYVVPVGGVPWAAFLSGRYIAGRTSAHVALFGDVEAGAFFDAVAMPGLHRDGSARFGGAVGAGAFVDARFGPWQADLWLGWAPGLTWGLEQHYLSAFVSLGRQLW